MPALLYAVTSVLVQAKSDFTVELDKFEVEYGKSLGVTISAKDLTQSLQQISLKKLSQEFYIDQKIYDKQAARQQLRLKLYPRHEGIIVFPALKLAEIASAKQTINVTTGKVKGEAIHFSVKQSASEPWQRQQLLITVEIITDDQFASLKTRTPIAPGFKVIPLKSGRQWIKEKGKQKTHLRTGWAVYPLLHGVQMLELPAVTYHLGGVQKRRYHLPQVRLSVKKLPPYIPPTLSVGKVTLTSNIEASAVLQNNTLAFWDLRLKSDELIPQWFPAVLRQIKSDNALEFFPVDSKRTLNRMDHAIGSEVIHRIPFKIKSSGWHRLPALQFQYFDPESARLVSVQHQPDSQFSLGLVWIVVAVLIMFVVLFFITRECVLTIRKYYRKREKIQRLLEELKVADNFNQLRELLREYGLIQQWPRNICMRDWLVNWCKLFNTDPKLHELINKITFASYAIENHEDISDIRRQLYTFLKHPQRNRNRLLFRRGFATR